MEKSNEKLLLPESLSRILVSLGISGIPSQWELKITELDFKLNLVWKRLECKEQTQTQVGESENGWSPDLNYSCNGTSLSSEIKASSLSRTDGEHVAQDESPKNVNYMYTKNECSGYQLVNPSEGREEEPNLSRYLEDSTKEESENSNKKKLKNSKTEQQQSDDHQEGVYHSNGCHRDDSLHGNKATCSCGEQFTFKERAVKHILFSCPVSLCFRIDLDIRIHDIINQWADEQQRIMGRKWWHTYKTSGVPDMMGTYPVNDVDELEEIINEFIVKAGTNELMDKNKNKFVLVKGLEGLPYELSGLIG